MTAWGKKLKKDWEHHAARVSFAKRKEFVHFNIGLTVDSLIPMGENLIWKGLQGEWSKVELRRHFLPPVFIPPLCTIATGIYHGTMPTFPTCVQCFFRRVQWKEVRKLVTGWRQLGDHTFTSEKFLQTNNFIKFVSSFRKTFQSFLAVACYHYEQLHFSLLICLSIVIRPKLVVLGRAEHTI